LLSNKSSVKVQKLMYLNSELCTLFSHALSAFLNP